MMIKNFQLFTHRYYKPIRNVSLAVIIFGIFILPGVLSLNKLDRQATEINRLTKQVKELSQRNVELSNQNKELNDRNIRYTGCVAQIFAQYTRDFKPVTIANLETCTTRTGGTSGDTAPTTSGSSSVQSTSLPNSNTAPAPAQPNNSQAANNNTSAPPDPDEPGLSVIIPPLPVCLQVAGQCVR